MPYTTSPVIVLKPHRIFAILIASVVVVLVLNTFFRWSSRSHKTAPINQPGPGTRFLPQENSKVIERQPPPKEQSYSGRPNLSKYIHLDLKGAPPKAGQFYESFFNFLDKLQMGVKGVIMEYEDMLPLQGLLANVTHRAAYSKEDIQLIEKAAQIHHLEIIPLIQTFGHLEWILKLKQFKSYRDTLDLPTVISPCVNATYALLEDLLQQTLNMHPSSKIIHIGCDEVSLNHASEHCHDDKIRQSERYIKHIQRVVNIVHKIRPGIRVLIWDDILRGDQLINDDLLLNQLKKLVEPVSWNYFTQFDDQYQSLPAWDIYPKLFDNVWAASAFKGGLHRFSITTDTNHHTLNNRQWLHFMQSPSFGQESFSAIILTGWSRFDHFMPLCDLLPTAYSSLIYSLHVLNTDEFLVDGSERDCEELLTAVGKRAELCDLLPGRNIWSSIASMSKAMAKAENRLKILDTISPDYNRKHGFVRRFELRSRLSELKYANQMVVINKKTLRDHFEELYTDDVINEWCDLYVNPLLGRINKTVTELDDALGKVSWQRRPFV